MIERPVRINAVIYRQHEVTAIRHGIGGDTSVTVRSSAGKQAVNTSHAIEAGIGLDFPEAEALAFALPFFDEVEDPYADVIEEQKDTIARQEQVIEEQGVEIEAKDGEIAEKAQLIEDVSEILTDDQAIDVPQVFQEWAAGVSYKAGDRRRYGDKLYKCVQGHVSQEDWTPDATPALWTEVAKPGEIPVWKQPTGAQDAYNIGDKVHYPDADGPVYESTIDANVYSPEAYPAGWQLVDEVVA